MTISFLPETKPTLNDAYVSVEMFNEQTHLKNQGAIAMIHSQFIKGYITSEALMLAASYYNRFLEIVKNNVYPEGGYHSPNEVFSENINTMICLCMIGLANKMLEDEPLLYYHEILKYNSFGYFNRYHTDLIPCLEDFNRLEREIVEALEFRL